MNRLLTLLAVVSSLVASETSAQVSDEVVAEARRQTFGERRADLIYANEQDQGVWVLTSIFSQPFDLPASVSRTPTPRWVARRQTGRLEEFSGEMTWADSRTCPALHGALWTLERLPLGNIDVAGVTPVRPSSGVASVMLPTHGPVVTVWAAGSQGDGAPINIRATAFGGPLVEWFERSEMDLESCWSAEPPAA